jgi:hypothetical protein
MAEDEDPYEVCVWERELEKGPVPVRPGEGDTTKEVAIGDGGSLFLIP